MKLAGILSVLILVGALAVLAVARYFLIQGYPLVGGGYEYNKRKNMTAQALAIVERPYFGSDFRYYRFELRQGRESGPTLRSLNVNALSGQEFKMPRGGLAFPVRWNDNGSITFFGDGFEITLKQ